MALFKYKLPELGEGLHEGEIVKWHIKPGDVIEEDQIIVEVQNDKAVVEVPSPVAGKVVEVKVQEGTLSVVGDVLATIEVEGEVEGEDEAESEVKPADTKPAEPVKAASPQSAPPVQTQEAVQPKAVPPTAKSVEGSGRKVLATPGVRKLAREQGIDLTKVPATGRNGRITKEDIARFTANGGVAVEEATQTSQQADTQVTGSSAAVKVAVIGSREEERVPLKGIRRAIANAMVKSVYTAPHVTIMDEANVTELVQLRRKVKPLAEKRGTKLTYLPFVAKALIAAAKQFPILNASLDDEKNEIVYKKYYSVGIATDTENGLIVPVVADADYKSIWAIADEIRDLATRGREGKLRSEEMRGSTISITNIGSAGGMFFTPVINYPEAAILGVGRITEKPIVKDGEIAVGQMIALSLSFDHRIIDGATAQHAMNYIKLLLEDPQLMILEV